MAFTVRVNDARVLIRLERLEGKLRIRSLHKIAGEVMRASIKDTFEQEGFPAGSWRLLHASTLAEQFTRGGANKKTRKKRGGDTIGFIRFARGKKILTDKGRLQNSITYRSSGKRLVIGTNLIYARIHQLGGVIVPKGGKKVLRIPIGGGKGIFRTRVTIPARPYLLIKPDDPRRIGEAIGDAVTRER